VTMFLIPHAMLPVAIVGLSDAWMNLRNKISNQHTSWWREKNSRI